MCRLEESATQRRSLDGQESEAGQGWSRPPSPTTTVFFFFFLGYAHLHATPHNISIRRSRSVGLSRNRTQAEARVLRMASEARQSVWPSGDLSRQCEQGPRPLKGAQRIAKLANIWWKLIRLVRHSATATPAHTHYLWSDRMATCI